MWTSTLVVFFSFHIPPLPALLKEPRGHLSSVYMIHSLSITILSYLVLSMGAIRANVGEALAKINTWILKEPICVTDVIPFLSAGSRIQKLASPEPVVYFSKSHCQVVCHVGRSNSRPVRGTDGFWRGRGSWLVLSNPDARFLAKEEPEFLLEPRKTYRPVLEPLTGSLSIRHGFFPWFPLSSVDQSMIR